MNVTLFNSRIRKLFCAFKSKNTLNSLLFNRVLAGSEHYRVLSPTLSTIIDIGANRGQFSLAARTKSPKARIIAFEPLEKPAATFRKVFRKDNNVILHKSAIGPYSGEALMHVTAADDSSSILEVSQKQVSLYPGTHEIREERVPIGRLSDYVKTNELIPRAMLKIDVQGFELQALIGCESLLNHISLIYAECSFVELYHGQNLANDVIEWLNNRHFQFNGIYNVAYDQKGNSIQADLLFKKTEY